LQLLHIKLQKKWDQFVCIGVHSNSDTTCDFVDWCLSSTFSYYLSPTMITYRSLPSNISEVVPRLSTESTNHHNHYDRTPLPLPHGSDPDQDGKNTTQQRWRIQLSKQWGKLPLSFSCLILLFPSAFAMKWECKDGRWGHHKASVNECGREHEERWQWKEQGCE